MPILYYLKAFKMQTTVPDLSDTRQVDFGKGENMSVCLAGIPIVTSQRRSALSGLALFLCIAFARRTVWPGQAIPQAAPINPDFIKWQQATTLISQQATLTAQNVHGLGYIPPPFTLPRPSGQGVSPNQISQLSVTPASYDLRTGNYMTPVKDQGSCGCCWCFATYGSLESWLLKNSSETWDLSEENLKNTSGFDWTACEGGNEYMSMAYLARSSGPVSEADDPYNPTDNISPAGLRAQKYVKSLEDFFTPSDIKTAIMTYGALYTTMYYNSSYYDSVTYCYYYNGSSDSMNHAVTLAGWDDNQPVTGAPGNGAWLVKNSWGAGWGNSGYLSALLL